MTVFRLFLENGSNDFVHFRSECRGDRYEDICKKPHVQKMSVLKIFIHKVAILAKNGQSGVQRSLYISRTVNATENLIRYSESTINSLSPITRQIFSYSSSSGRKIDSKTANFNALFEGIADFPYNIADL